VVVVVDVEMEVFVLMRLFDSVVIPPSTKSVDVAVLIILMVGVVTKQEHASESKELAIFLLTTLKIH
jgi:hypothetical protein